MIPLLYLLTGIAWGVFSTLIVQRILKPKPSCDAKIRIRIFLDGNDKPLYVQAVGIKVTEDKPNAKQ